jgi:glutamate racemase
VIGVFDSGVGGLSVWREIAGLMPNEPIIYLADQAHVPYGPRSLNEVRALTTRCINWLIEQGCSMVVIACNTASAAALNHVRRLYPNTPIVGMEPAVKPAATHTQTGVIGVLATQATFQGELFASVVMRFASHVKVIEQPCPGWVKLVEGAAQDENALENCQPLINHYVGPLLDAGADALVLGCTHFPFLSQAIRCHIDEWSAQHQPGYQINLIDPSAAVARQTMRVRDAHGLSQAVESPLRKFYTTGDAASFQKLAQRLLPDATGLCMRHIVCAETSHTNREL